MLRIRFLIFVLLVAIGNPSRTAAQSEPAPIYALPADGTWVEYTWQATDRYHEERTGLLRISSVGRKEVKDAACRWIEIRLEARDGDKMTRRLRKFLVAPRAFTRGQSFEDHVLEGFAQSTPKDGVIRLPTKRLYDFLNLGLNAQTLTEVQKQAEVKTPLGSFRTRHVSAAGSRGPRTLTYDAWLTDDMPFGWCQIEVHEQRGAGPALLVFRATASRNGRDAKSELDETKATGAAPRSH